MKPVLRENLVKNLLLVLLLVLLFFPIQAFILRSPLAADEPAAGDVLVAVSILAVIACFGNFAFTYEKCDMRKASHRYLAHVTTGMLMLLIGVSLIFTSVLLRLIMGEFLVVEAALIMLYAACVLYDFWDLFRAE